MNLSSLKPALFTNNAAFDWLYPERVQQLSKRHWTPISIARQAARFLADVPGKRVLDIGSGVGKFCLVGAHYCPEAVFYGVEQRPELYHYAQAAKLAVQTNNVQFINANFTELSFDDFDSFYFYNAFFENLDDDDRIDHQIEYSVSLYTYYTRYLYKMLDSRPAGTRLVTFHSFEEEVPPSYQVVQISDDLMLKMWIKR